MKQRVAVECREARRAVRHKALTLGRPDGRAQVRLAGQARRALPTLRRVKRDDMVSLLDRLHSRADIDHDSCSFMAQDRGEQSLRIRSGKREFVRMTNAGRLDLDHDLAFTGAFQIHVHNLKRFSCCGSNGGASSHCFLLSWKSSEQVCNRRSRNSSKIKACDEIR